MKNHYSLSLDFLPLMSDFVYPVSNLGKRILHVYDRSVLSDECRAWIEESGLRFHKLFIFEDPGVNNVRIVHVDGTKNQGKKFAVNWNIGSGKFVMEWFSLKENAEVTSLDSLQQPYAIFDEKDAELVESSSSTGAVLFNTSAPHSVMNLDNNVRYGVTLRFFNNLTWDEAVSFLSKYINK